MEEIINLEGVLIHYYRYGESMPPVVLLHGGGTDSALLSWGLLHPVLAQERLVYLPDWPGYGSSGPLSGEYTVAALAELVAKILDALNLPQVDLAGISMGGGAALGFTLDHPERVRKLILVDSYGLANKAPFHLFSYLMVKLPGFMALNWRIIRSRRSLTRMALANIFADQSSISDTLVDEVYQALNSGNAGEAFTLFQRSEMMWNRLRSCYFDRLQDLQPETLIIHGENDTLVPILQVRQAAQRIPRARLVVIPNCGHWPQREQPEIFNQHALEFLNS